MKAKNEFRMTVDSRSVNESFVRSAVAAFASQRCKNKNRVKAFVLC